MALGRDHTATAFGQVMLYVHVCHHVHSVKYYLCHRSHSAQVDLEGRLLHILVTLLHQYCITWRGCWLAWYFQFHPCACVEIPYFIYHRKQLLLRILYKIFNVSLDLCFYFIVCFTSMLVWVNTVVNSISVKTRHVSFIWQEARYENLLWWNPWVFLVFGFLLWCQTQQYTSYMTVVCK